MRLILPGLAHEVVKNIQIFMRPFVCAPSWLHAFILDES